MKMFSTKCTGIFIRNESYWFIISHKRHSTTCIDDWQWEQNMYRCTQITAHTHTQTHRQTHRNNNNNNNTITPPSTEALENYYTPVQWHPHTMHSQHIMDFVLFHFHSSAKCVYFSLPDDAAATNAAAAAAVCAPQIFPCTRASCPRTFLRNFQFEFASNNLFRSVWWKLQQQIPNLYPYI